MNAQRTDVHRPSAIRPEDYSYVASYDTQPPVLMPPLGVVTQEWLQYAKGQRLRWQEQFDRIVQPLRDSTTSVYNSPNRCDHCGAYLRYGNIYRHAPTGQVIAVGDICAEETMDVPDRARLEQKRLREAAASARMREAEGKAARERREVAEQHYPQAAGILNAALQELAAVRAHNEQVDANLDLAAVASGTAKPQYRELDVHPVIADIAERFGRHGHLSEKQAAFVVRLVQQEREREQRQAQAAADVDSGKVEPVPETAERIEVTGTVTRAYIKRYNDYDDGRFVMIVRDDRGFSLWGSVPTSISMVDLPEGGQRSLDTDDRVAFSAKVERSDRDSSFGFFKRPTKARVLQS